MSGGPTLTTADLHAPIEDGNKIAEVQRIGTGLVEFLDDLPMPMSHERDLSSCGSSPPLII
jgi:hypothetical protein